MSALWMQQLQSPVAVLLGGRSAEREISLKSGAAVLAALARLGIDAQAIDPADADWLERLKAFRHAFIALHGPGGEDGTVQGALELLNISYTGSGVLASALAMDKLRSKQLWRGIGLPTPDFAMLADDTDFAQLLSHWGEAIVKPVHEGSSIGMARARNAGELASAYAVARRYDSSVLAEQWITGSEYTVAVLGTQPLPAIRLETDRDFYDYEAKYQSTDTRYICPCGLSAEEEGALQQLALAAFASLDCTGWGRVDFMRDSNGCFLLLEVNTVPGMTDHSLVPMAARAAGRSFDELVAEILRLSLEAAA